MGHHHIEIKQEKFEFTSRSKMVSVVLLIAGLLLSVIGVMQLKNNGDKSAAHKTEQVAGAHAEGHDVAPAHGEGHEKSWTVRFWANMLLNSYYFLLFGIGALFFVALNYGLVFFSIFENAFQNVW